MRVRPLPATWVAAVAFDPNVASPEVVDHRLSDRCRRQKKERKIRGVASAREVDPSDPRRERRNESRTEAQFLVRR